MKQDFQGKKKFKVFGKYPPNKSKLEFGTYMSFMSFIWFSQSIHCSYSDKQGVFFRVVFCYFNFIDCCNYYCCYRF